MKRKDFLKRLEIGTAAVIAAPSIIKAMPENDVTAINGAESKIFYNNAWFDIGNTYLDSPYGGHKEHKENLSINRGQSALLQDGIIIGMIDDLIINVSQEPCIKDTRMFYDCPDIPEYPEYIEGIKMIELKGTISRKLFEATAKLCNKFTVKANWDDHSIIEANVFISDFTINGPNIPISKFTDYGNTTVDIHMDLIGELIITLC